MDDLFQALNTAALFFYENDIIHVLGITPVFRGIGMHDYRKHRNSIQQMLQHMSFIGIGKIRIQYDQIKRFTLESPFKDFPAGIRQPDPIACRRHFALQKHSDMRISISN